MPIADSRTEAALGREEQGGEQGGKKHRMEKQAQFGCGCRGAGMVGKAGFAPGTLLRNTAPSRDPCSSCREKKKPCLQMGESQGVE